MTNPMTKVSGFYNESSDHLKMVVNDRVVWDKVVPDATMFFNTLSLEDGDAFWESEESPIMRFRGVVPSTYVHESLHELFNPLRG